MPDNNSTQPGQLENFVEKTAHMPEPAERTTDEQGRTTAARRVPFETALSQQLSGEQEQALVDFALKRVKDLEQELGRDLVLGEQWAASDKMADQMNLQRATDTFMGKRARYEAVFKNKVDWRPYIFGGIFKQSNLVVPMARRIARQMIARAQNYFFSTDPWFNAEPEGIEDIVLAQKIDRFAKYKLGVLGSKKSKERAVKLAFIRGECVVKTAYAVRDQLFQTFAKVLVNVKGEPILDSRGEHITDTDKWQDPTQVDPASGKPIPVAGPQVLARDGITQQPATLIWLEMAIPRRQVIFEGPESNPVYYKDFLCPLAATDVQQADLIAHLYDKPVMELVDLYAKRGELDLSTSDRVEAVKKTIALIRELINNGPEAKSGANRTDRPGDENGSRTSSENRGEAVAELAECYLWYDANGDGILENIMLVVDRKNRVPIFYDYVPNISIDGMRPFEVVRVNEIDGRWYGEGVMEMFESTQTIVDLLVNRWNVSQSSAGRVDFWRPDLTLEGQADASLKLNWGGSYTAKPGIDPEQILHSVYLEDTKFDALQTMFEFFMQVAMNESGVANSNDAETAGLDTQKLATGIRNIEKAGQELFAPFLSDLEPSLQAILTREMLVMFANVDPIEVFKYLDTDVTTGKEIQRIDQINADEVRNLRMNVSLLLTRYKGEQQFAQMAQGSEIVERFYMQHPLVQAKVAPFYRQMLRALDPKINADQVISPLPPEAMLAPAGAPGIDKPGGALAAGPGKPGKSPANL